MAQTYGLAIIPWSPLAGGLLSGKHQRNQDTPADSRFASIKDKPWLQRRWHEGVFDVLEGLEPLVQDKGYTLAQFALAWCVQQPGVTSPIIGPRTMEQLEDNLGALDVVITEADRAKIDELVPPGRMVSPFYDAEFGPHPYRW